MTGFLPYEYVPQFSEGSAQVGTGTGSGEGAGYSTGAFCYLNGDTASGLELVGYRNGNGEVYIASEDERGFAVMDKFLCIPTDGTLATMSVCPFSFTTLENFSSDVVANGLSVSVIQASFDGKLPTPARSDELVLYGPEPFTQVDNVVRRLRPVASLRPGLPMFLRIVSITAFAESFLPVTRSIVLESPEGNIPPAQPVQTILSPAKYRLLYSIPMSISRVQK